MWGKKAEKSVSDIVMGERLDLPLPAWKLERHHEIKPGGNLSHWKKQKITRKKFFSRKILKYLEHIELCIKISVMWY